MGARVFFFFWKQEEKVKLWLLNHAAGETATLFIASPENWHPRPPGGELPLRLPLAVRCQWVSEHISPFTFFFFFLVCAVVFRHKNTWTSHRIRSWVTWPPRTLRCTKQSTFLCRNSLMLGNKRTNVKGGRGGKTARQLGRWGRGNRPLELRLAEPCRSSVFVPLKGGRL